MKIELTELEISYIKEVLVNDFMTQESMFRLAFNPAKAIEFIVIRNSLKKSLKLRIIDEN